MVSTAGGSVGKGLFGYGFQGPAFWVFLVSIVDLIASWLIVIFSGKTREEG